MKKGDTIKFDDGSEGTILWHKDEGIPCPYAVVGREGQIEQVATLRYYAGDELRRRVQKEGRR